MRDRSYYYTGKEWFGNLFDGVEWPVPERDGHVLRYSRKISEKVHDPPVGEKCTCQAVAVYEADYLIDGKFDESVIAKIYMQIPNMYGADKKPLLHPRAYASQAVSESYPFTMERASLHHLTSMECSCTPELKDWFEEIQTDRFYLLGGFLKTLVMEKLPGKPMNEVWDPNTLPPKLQTEILESFKATRLEVRRHNVCNIDPRLPNLLWNQDTHKCYMIDFETSWSSMPDIVDSSAGVEMDDEYWIYKWGF